MSIIENQKLTPIIEGLHVFRQAILDYVKDTETLYHGYMVIDRIWNELQEILTKIMSLMEESLTQNNKEALETLNKIDCFDITFKSHLDNLEYAHEVRELIKHYVENFLNHNIEMTEYILNSIKDIPLEQLKDIKSVEKIKELSTEFIVKFETNYIRIQANKAIN